MKLIPFVLLFFSLVFGCKQRSENVKLLKEPIITDTYLQNNPDSGVRIFLTFDDGPYQTTPQLAQLLDNLKLKASFFIVGSQIKFSNQYDSIFRATKGNKHFRIYNHTFSHAVTKGRIHRYYRYPNKVWDDISINKSLISTGGDITRLPGKNAWRIDSFVRGLDYETYKLIDFLKKDQKDESIVGWDVEWNLKHSKSREEVDSLINEISSLILRDSSRQKEVVILSHDYLYRTKESLDNFTYFVQRLKDNFRPSFHWVEELNLIQSK